MKSSIVICVLICLALASADYTVGIYTDDKCTVAGTFSFTGIELDTCVNIGTIIHEDSASLKVTKDGENYTGNQDFLYFTN